MQSISSYINPNTRVDKEEIDGVMHWANSHVIVKDGRVDDNPRVHIVGDDVYAPNIKNKFKTNGQLLHAYKIKFTHPKTKQEMEFETPLPNYFKEIVDYLEEQY